MVFSRRTGSADKRLAKCLVLSGNAPMLTSTTNHTPKPNGTPTATPTVTPSLTLIKTEYWDRAGGGGNISYDW